MEQREFAVESFERYSYKVCYESRDDAGGSIEIVSALKEQIMSLSLVEEEREMGSYIIRNFLEEEEEEEEELAWRQELNEVSGCFSVPPPLRHGLRDPSLPPDSLFRVFNPYELEMSERSRSSKGRRLKKNFPSCGFCKGRFHLIQL